MENETVSKPLTRRSRTSRALRITAILLLSWLVVAYVIAPGIWEEYARHDPALDGSPTITQTGDHHPGDPLNVELAGTQLQLENAMKASGWYSAAALGLKSDLKIAADTVLSRPDDAAPVSNLFLFGRKEDLAFEQPVGNNPRHRHHVRFWKTDNLSEDGRPKWIGSAVYDKRVGLSHTTGQITHVTAPDIDTERDYLFECLKRSGSIVAIDAIDDFQKVRTGRNGGGDPWQTDGRLYTGTLVTPGEK